MRAANREGRPAIEAAPVSIVGLGADAFTSAASAAPTIIITTTHKAAEAYLPEPAIVGSTYKNPNAAGKY